MLIIFRGAAKTDKYKAYIFKMKHFLILLFTADNNSTENTPVQDTPNLPPSLSPFNLMDAQSEAACLAPCLVVPYPAVPCPAVPCPTVPRILKENKRLIVFSNSSSVESVPRSSAKETQHGRVDDVSAEGNLHFYCPKKTLQCTIILLVFRVP